MTIRDLFRTRVLAPVCALALASCSPEQAADPAPPQVAQLAKPQAAVALVPDAPKPAQPVAAQPAQPEQPPPVFSFPTDLGGKALPRVVVPNISAALPADRAGVAPVPRAIPAKVLDPDPNGRAAHALPPVPTPKAGAPKPTNPAEKVPVDLGAGADGVPAKPVLPVAAVVTERARDVNIPPPAPALGRPASDRVPFDDPTSELGNGAVVAGPAKVPPVVTGFFKASVPDPFELGAQVKPAVPAAAEPSPLPVVVNPARVK
jgi:hypothetical protein